MEALRRAIFLDRDGTLNVEKNYLYRPEDWQWIPGSIDAIRLVSELGFRIIVVSNQAGIARGLYTTADVDRLHSFVAEDLSRKGLAIDAYRYCPHHPEHGNIRNCGCRKPEPGLLLDAARDFGIDLARSWMIGDKLIDLEAGRRAGVRSILVRTGYGAGEESRAPDATPVVDDLRAAALFVRDQQGRS